ncbi:MAG: helix-turn-helix domain-containing protein, partial [Stackebrandtia sp.]
MGEERDETGNWGQKLLAYRLRASMSQEDLARVTGLSVRGIRLIENGHRRPRASTVTILTEGLRLSEAETVAVVEAVRPQSRVNGPPAAAVTAMPIPRQLPAPPKGLVGRDADLAVLDDELVSADNPLCLIVGPGGIGKTWLAVHWANLHRDRFPDGQLYVNLRGFDPEAEPITPLNALRSILTALGIPAAGTSADVDDLAALYR